MSQGVCKKVSRTAKEMLDLPDDIVIQFFSRLNYRDRAYLATTCSRLRLLGRSQYLWQSLDLRMPEFDVKVAKLFASRCADLRKVQFHGGISAHALIELKARELKEISGENCSNISDDTLKLIASNYTKLESLQLGWDIFGRVTSDAITEVAGCCTKLQKLRLSGIEDIGGVAVNALARNCPHLTEIGFIHCLNVDMKTLGNVLSLRFLSVAGSSNIDWLSASKYLSGLPNLKCLDVSRTSICYDALTRLLSSSENLTILCALGCPVLDHDPRTDKHKSIKDKLLLTLSTNIFEGLSSLFVDTTMEDKNIFSSWRKITMKNQNLNEVMTWLEWILSQSLLWFAKSNQEGMHRYWSSQGVALLLCLTQSTQADIQEMAVAALSSFATADYGYARAIAQEGGILLLLNLAKSWREGLQIKAAVAIKNLSYCREVKLIVEEVGGIEILANLARSKNRWLVKEAVAVLRNLSTGEIHKDAYVGVVHVLVNVIKKWTTDGDGILKCAAGALANLVADNKYSMLVVEVGGLTALVGLAQMCTCKGVQKQVARALANLASHGDTNACNAAIGEELGAVEVLVKFLYSPSNGVREVAVIAVSNLCFYARNREAIAAGGGVDALVSLADTCTYDAHASNDLQEKVVRALREFCVSESDSIRIGTRGGIASLLALGLSMAKGVHESAAEALWTLSFHHINAMQIVDEEGLPYIAHHCTSSLSKMVRFVSVLTLTYIFDRRMDEFCLSRDSTGRNLKRKIDAFRSSAMKSIDDFIFAFSDPQLLSAVATSSSPALLTEVALSAYIVGTAHLRCSGAEIERFTYMLRSSCMEIRTCAAFALLQFTFRGNLHAAYHASLLQNTRARAALRAAAASATGSVQSKIYAKIVLRNLEHHDTKTAENDV
ncbi:hypothetical protein ACET3Z_026220 [Daucus carota]